MKLQYELEKEAIENSPVISKHEMTYHSIKTTEDEKDNKSPKATDQLSFATCSDKDLAS